MTIMNADALEQLSRPQVGWQRLLVAVLQGALLYWLYRAGTDKLWPATVPTLFIPLLMVAIFCPVLLIVSLGHLAPRRIAVWIGSLVLLVAALGWYDGWRSVRLPEAGSAPSPLLFVHLIAGLFIAHTLVAAANVEQRRIASYPSYFDAAWKLAVQLVFSAGFVGAVWLVLNLGGELFKLIKLDFIERLLRHAWFNIPVIVFSFACAIHITDVRPAIVRGIRSLILVLMAWLLPVVTILVGGFLLSLPFTGLAPLWSTRHAAAVLLGAAALLVLMINTAWQNGAALPGVAAPVRWSARIAAVLLAPLVLIAAWALHLRVSDYGWTDDRVVAASCIAIAACYALGYLVAAIRSRSLEPIAGVNIATSFAVLAMMLAIFSPLLDPARVSVNSQLAQLQSGKVAPDKFDYMYLRFSGERYGNAALLQLQAQTTGAQAAAIRAGAARALAAKSKWEQRQRQQELTAPAMLANLTMHPAGATLPPGLLAYKPDENLRYRVPACLTTANVHCDVFAIDFGNSGKSDLLVLSEGNAPGSIFREGKDGAWRQIETLPYELAGCPAFRKRLIAGDFKLVTPARRAIEVGGRQFQPQPVHDGSVVDCPP